MPGGPLKRILVVKLADIGDLLTATPALRALRESYPDAHIAALVAPNSADVLRDSPLLDELIVFDKFRFDRLRDVADLRSLASAAQLLCRLRSGRFDAVAVLHHLVTRWGRLKYALLALGCGAPERAGLDNGSGWFLTIGVRDPGFGAQHEVEYCLAVAAALGARTSDRTLMLPVTIEDELWVAQVVREVAPDPSHPLVVIHPGTGRYAPSRRWPAECFAAVADGLATRSGAQAVLVGGHEEVALARQVAGLSCNAPPVLAGRTTLRQLAALLRRAAVFIGNDSGVMHVATAVGTPVVAVFGPSNHRAWGPYTGGTDVGQPRSTVVRVDLPCSPCLYPGSDHGNRWGCATMDCLRLVTPEMVVAAAERLLAGQGAFGG